MFFSLIRNIKPTHQFIKNKSFVTVEKRFKNDLSKATIFFTRVLDDGSTFISRVPEKPVKVNLDQLPPPIRPKNTMPPTTKLSKDQIEEMRHLRLEDPFKWKVSVLTKEYNVSPTFVKKFTSVSEEIKLKREEELKLRWERMGYKRQLIHINRLRRRALW